MSGPAVPIFPRKSGEAPRPALEGPRGSGLPVQLALLARMAPRPEPRRPLAMPMVMHPSRMLPAGRPGEPLPRAPIPPSTAQQAGGRIETVGPPEGGRQRVSREQSARLLETAEASADVLRGALERGGHPAASPRDRHVARVVHRCMVNLVQAAGPFGQIVSELRHAQTEGREAELTAAQVASLEVFAACAAEAVARAEGQVVADAAVGAGLPAGLLVALAFI